MKSPLSLYLCFSICLFRCLASTLVGVVGLSLCVPTSFATQCGNNNQGGPNEPPDDGGEGGVDEDSDDSEDGDYDGWDGDWNSPNAPRAGDGKSGPRGGPEGIGGGGLGGGGCNKFAVFTGNVHREVKDLEVWGGVGEHQLVWKRYGNSRFDYSGQRFFGWAHQWRHSYQWQMADAGMDPQSGQPRLDVFYPEGTVNRFTKISNTEWRSSPKVKDRIIQSGTTWTLLRASGWQYHFKLQSDAQGNTFYQLKDFQDSQQATYTLTYGAPGPNGFPELIKVSEPAGRYLSIQYDNVPYFTDQTQTIATITQQPPVDDWSEVIVTDPGYYRYAFYVDTIGTGCAVAEIEFYEYGTNQKLSGTPLGSSPPAGVGYECDKAFDGDPNTWFSFSNTYYGYTGLDFGSAKRIGKIRYRPAWMVDLGGQIMAIAMAGGHFRAANLAPAMDRVISKVSTSDGRNVIYHYQNYPDSVLPTDYAGLESVDYGDGTGAQYDYGVSIGGTVPLLIAASDTRYKGRAAQMEYHYHTENIGVIGFVHEELNAISGAVMATLTGNGSEEMYVEYANGAQDTYSFPWAQAGRLNTRANALGNQKQFTYDQGGMGYLVSRKDANNHTTQYQRNTSGKLTQILYADGSKKNWTRDNLNLVTSVTDELGRVTAYTRDSQHRVTAIEYPDKSTETFTYNAFNQVTAHQLRNGGTEYNTYDARGLKTSHTDPLGNVTTYTYDSADRLASETDANHHTTQYEYNARGLVTQITYADQTTRQFGYDDFGNKTSETNELGKTWTYTYDEFSRLKSATDPLNHTTYYSYGIGLAGCGSCHLEDKPTSITLPSGKQTAYTYDLLWRKTSETVGANGSDAATTQYEYDAVGNLLTRIDPLQQAWQYAYDARNRLTDAMDPLGRQTSWGYDAAGNKQMEMRPDGNATTYSYTAMNQLASVTDALKQTTEYQYDSGGNLVTLTDAKGHAYQYGYDLLHRIVSLKYPDATKETYQYDAVGNREQYTTRAGQVMTCTFDSRNRELTSDWNDTTPDLVKSYDLAGRLIQLNNSASQIHYTYNDANQLIQEQQTITGYPSTLTVGYQYNADGALNGLTYPGGPSPQYSYTGRNQIAGVYLSSAVATYQYDLAGQRLAKTLGNGTATQYKYDEARQLKTVSHLNPNGLFAANEYSYDLNGNRLAQQRADGTFETYKYDEMNQLVNAFYDSKVLGQSSREVTYQYDAVGNREQVTENGASVLYSANAVNQYTAVAGSTLSYSANGNLSSHAGWNYTYDAQNRLESAHQGATQISFVYDGLNRCVKRTVNGIPTYLCYAGWNLIEERSGNGNVLATYIHGAATDEILTKSDANGTVYYHQDALGNVTHLTDFSGSVIEQYRYDAYGHPAIFDAQGSLLASSAFGNRFLFTGREWLEQAQLYDYRNRLYSADLGRFLQTDPLRFEAGDVNLYRYVFNNPINLWDPYGLYDCMDFMYDLSNFSAGAGDALSFGLTNWARDQMGTNDVVDHASGMYAGGKVTGTLVSMARGAATAKAVGGKAINAMTNRTTLPPGPSLPGM